MMKTEKEFNNERSVKKILKKNVGFDINRNKDFIKSWELKTGSDCGFLNNIKTISNY